MVGIVIKDTNGDEIHRSTYDDPIEAIEKLRLIIDGKGRKINVPRLVERGYAKFRGCQIWYLQGEQV